MPEFPATFVSPLVKDYLSPDLDETLVPEDFENLERLRQKLLAHPTQAPPDANPADPPMTPEQKRQMDIGIVDAMLAASERTAVGARNHLLFDLFDHESATPTIRARCACSLARSGDVSPDALSLYADFLSERPDPAAVKIVLTTLQPLWKIQFNAPLQTIAAAEACAAPFAKISGFTPGVATILGLAALALRQDATTATQYFYIALNLNAQDPVAILGQVVSLLREGHYKSALERMSFCGLGSEGDSLSAFAQALRWLDGDGENHSQPASAAQLNPDHLRPWVGWLADFAIARLRLIEGDNTGASGDFDRLAEQHPREPRIAYYGAWADYLTGKHDLARKWLHPHQNWSGAWTLICRAWDADPESPSQQEASAILGRLGPEVSRMLLLRKSSCGNEPLATLLAGMPAGSLEEDLEAHRIILGNACLRRDIPAFETALNRPLSRLLPASDLRFWQAAQFWLNGDTSKARRLFEEAAGTLSHPRAGWALAILHAQADEKDQAQEWTERALSHRHDANTEAWRSWLNGSTPPLQASDGGEMPGNSRASWMRAQFLFTAADTDRRQGRLDDARNHLEQAGALLGAMKSRCGKMPEDPALLEACARFLLDPDRGAPILAAQWPALENAGIHASRPWLVWLAAMAKVHRRDSRHVASVCQALGDLLPKLGPGSELAIAALAGSLAQAAADAPDMAIANLWLDLLSRLPESVAQKGGQDRQRMSLAARAWQRAANASGSEAKQLAETFAPQLKADTGNALLALIVAYLHLISENRVKAAKTLAVAKPETPANSALLKTICGALKGRSEVPMDVATFDPSCASTLLLQGMSAFAQNQPESGYDSVLKAWRLQPEAIAKAVKLTRLITSLCARSRKMGGAPPQLLQAVRDLSATAASAEELDVLARCAVALNNNKTARELWERAVADEFEAGAPVRLGFGHFLCHLAVEIAKRATAGSLPGPQQKEMQQLMALAADQLEKAEHA
jgi:tetratricopeptide (TPR) repeat protein